eukprot:TRINITY_DN1852_c0_g4_i3.p1 TRINITY_DN1852_c0_g4~~TRINITY_DN1852_c0_g4_i3.p1  ORF type:complete len:901 (+),score=161.80 TRINITY_DN1852_c0_g4_i3:31-2703(+)
MKKKKPTLTLPLLFIPLLLTITHAINQGDKEALFHLKTFIQIPSNLDPNWCFNLEWETRDICARDNQCFTCDPDGYLYSLDLNHYFDTKGVLRVYNMTGDLSLFQWGDFQRLRILNLRGNRFYGDLGSLVNATWLERLDVSGNQFSGEIPALVSPLVLIDGRGNQFSEQVPDSIFQRNLEFVDLSYNTIRGSIPDRFNESKKLRQFKMEKTKITGTIPESLLHLKNLEELILSRNDGLEGTISQSIGNLTSLRFLDLQENKLRGPIPDNIYSLSNLQYMYLNNNRNPTSKQGGLTGTISPKISGLKNLKNMHIGFNSIEGVLPAEIFELENLKELFINNNQLSSGFYSDLRHWKKLERLNIGGNQFTGTIPKGIWNLENLKYFACSDSQFSGSIPDNITAYNLEEIILNTQDKKNIPKLSGTIPESFWKLEKLSHIVFSYQNFEGNISSSISGMKNLKHFDIQHCNFDGPFPPIFEGPSKVDMIVYVDHNKLRGEISQSIGKHYFTKLNFENNEIQGVVPTYFGREVYVGKDDQAILSNNMFSCIDFETKLYKRYGAKCDWSKLISVNQRYFCVQGDGYVNISGRYIPDLPESMHCYFKFKDNILKTKPSLITKDRTIIQCPIPSKQGVFGDAYIFIKLRDSDITNGETGWEIKDNQMITLYEAPVLHNASISSYSYFGSKGEPILTLKGKNFIDTGSQVCSFGSSVVPAIFVASDTIQCSVPQSTLGLVNLTFGNDLLYFSNALPFTFFEYCDSPSVMEDACGWPTHGYCDNSTIPHCICKTSGYDPVDCGRCRAEYWGSNCSNICETCESGVCSSGFDGDGECKNCNFLMAGPKCDTFFIIAIGPAWPLVVGAISVGVILVITLISNLISKLKKPKEDKLLSDIGDIE